MFRVVSGPIDAEAVRRAVESDACGAVVLFHGTVRDCTEGRAVTHLEYEAFVALAERRLAEIGAEVVAQHGLDSLACVHRTGRLAIGDVAIVVATSAPHRRAALDAVDDFVRLVKQDVPIWKKEHFRDGAVWVGTPEQPSGGRTA